MGITVSEEEKRSVEHVLHPVLTTIILVNDYYSDDKVLAAYIKGNSATGVSNSVWLLMNVDGVDTKECQKSSCR